MIRSGKHSVFCLLWSLYWLIRKSCKRSPPIKGQRLSCPLRPSLAIFFSSPKMQWIGQLKRLSSGWPIAVKSSPAGCRDAAGGRLHLRLIQRFIVIIFLCCHAQALNLSGLIAKCLLPTWTCFSHSNVRSSFLFMTLVDFGDVPSSSCWRCKHKGAGGQTSEAEAGVGGREDGVAVSLWLSRDLKLWSGSFRLSLMNAALWPISFFWVWFFWQIAEMQS